MHVRASLVGLVIVAAACAPAPQSGPPTLSPTPSPTASLNASPAPVLDDRFGLLMSDASIGPQPAVRRESDAQPVFPAVFGAVSPDGRRIAHWAGQELQVIDVAPGARSRTLLALGAAGTKENAEGVVWSSDSTGLLVGVTAEPINAGADAPPAYSALRVLDATGGQPREIARILGGRAVPLAWDRQARLAAAYETFSAGIGYYDVITEDGKVERAQIVPPVPELQASPDAKQIFARGFSGDVLRVWPLTGIARSVELSSAAGKRILATAWRPGTAEIGVLFDDRLEIWDTSGARRPVPLPSLPPTSNVNRTLIFRADGSAVFVGLVLDPTAGAQPDVYCVAVDLRSGRSAVVPTRGVLPSASVRIAP